MASSLPRLWLSACSGLTGQKIPREYFIRHVAFWLPENVNEYAGYNKLFEACESRFAQQVALRLTECYNDTHVDKYHPSEEPGFQNARAEAIRLGYTTLKSPEDYLNKVLETRNDKAGATSSASLNQAAKQEVPGQAKCLDQQ